MLIVKVGSTTTTFDLGAYLQGASYDTGQVTNQEVKVLCYPSGGGINIILPATNFPDSPQGFTAVATQNLLVLVADASGDAGKNGITVTGALVPNGLNPPIQETVNGKTSVSISNAYASADLEILTGGAWVAGYNNL